MTKAGKGALNPVRASEDKKEGVRQAGPAAEAGTEIADADTPHPDDRKVDRRRRQVAWNGTERRRASRRHSDRVAASFTSAFVAQWLGQEIAGGEPGDELALRRSANLVYNAVQEREAQYFRTLGRNARKSHDYS
jgi:hypothetical protein